jgi:hypothetical protein
MKRLLITILVVTAIFNASAQSAPTAQADLCTGLKAIFKESMNRFENWDMYNLGSIGIGSRNDSGAYYSVWGTYLSYKTKAAAVAKYNQLETALKKCTIGNSKFTYKASKDSGTTYNAGNWSLPASNEYKDVSVRITTTNFKNEYRLNFTILNNKKEEPVTQTGTATSGSKLCDALNTVLLSGTEFSKVTASSPVMEGIEFYTSTTGIDGITGYVMRTSSGVRKWYTTLLKTTDFVEALKSCNTLVTRVTGCNLPVGTFHTVVNSRDAGA